MIEICAIASGSNGNCYYIGNETDAILVDAGINSKQLYARLKSRSIDHKKIRAIFITHEHADHCKGARVFSGKVKIPVYLTKGTYDSLYEIYRPAAYRIIEGGMPVEVAGFTIHPVTKKHDGKEPVSFRIEQGSVSVGVFTDLGEPCERVIDQIGKCDALFLETNYDETMLMEGSYPYPLKMRISSDVGHLSNHQAYELLNNHGGDRLRLVLLSHLSGENNSPEKAYHALQPLKDRYRLVVTSRHEAGEILTVNEEPADHKK